MLRQNPHVLKLKRTTPVDVISHSPSGSDSVRSNAKFHKIAKRVYLEQINICSCCNKRFISRQEFSMVTLRDKRFRVSRRVNTSLDSAWLILTDTLLWPLWGPSVTAVESSDRFIRAGTTGRVKTALFFWLPFVITTYVDNRSWRWTVGTLQATGHTVEQGVDGTTVVSFDVPWWAFFYVPICWLALRRIDSLARQ
jgi:hypothetical protein